MSDEQVGRVPEAASAGHVVVDPETRTYWRRGQPAPETLVETGDDEPEATVAPLGHRLATAVAERERRRLAGRRRPVVAPSFAEALFVELLREGRYDRAYALLAPECQRAWGSVERFAAAQRGAARLLGVEVRRVRLLAEWRDQDRLYHDVAEVEAEYTLRHGDGTHTVSRVVHLVAIDGQWRSLCWPASTDVTPRRGRV